MAMVPPAVQTKHFFYFLEEAYFSDIKNLNHYALV
jgi:hypothetical protein